MYEAMAGRIAPCPRTTSEFEDAAITHSGQMLGTLHRRRTCVAYCKRSAMMMCERYRIRCLVDPVLKTPVWSVASDLAPHGGAHHLHEPYAELLHRENENLKRQQNQRWLRPRYGVGTS